MKRFDLIVIGTGLAGLTAARTAIGMGAKVLIVGRGMGALTLFGNTVDLLGEIPPETEMAEGMTHWIAAHPEHPYARTGWEGSKRNHRIPRTLPAALPLLRLGPGELPSAHRRGDDAPHLAHPRHDGRRRRDDPGRDVDRRLPRLQGFSGRYGVAPPEMPGVILPLPATAWRV